MHSDTGWGYYLYKDRSQERKILAPDLLKEDGLPSYSPRHGYFITDTYPDKFGEQNLLLYNCHNKSVMKLGGFFRPFKYFGEKRCDLHPRWSQSGQSVVIDSAHEGKRAMYIIKVFN